MDGELVLQRLNDSENGALGFLAGAIEAVATQPLTYWKNAAQQGLGFTLNPRLLYRGTTVSAINDGTLTAFQFAASGWFQKLFAGGAGSSSGFVSGAGGAARGRANKRTPSKKQAT